MSRRTGEPAPVVRGKEPDLMVLLKVRAADGTFWYIGGLLAWDTRKVEVAEERARTMDVLKGGTVTEVKVVTP